MPVARSARPVALAVGGLAVVPVAASWALWHPVGVEQAGSALCPFRALTGVPCPLCGATRAFVYFFNGDGRFVDYNWAWLVLWAALLAWGVAALLRLRAGRPPPLGPLRGGATAVRAHPLLLVGALLLALLPFWALAFANSGTILGP